MPVRTLRLLLLLSTLLFAQLGGILHGLHHAQDDPGQPHPPCELCVAYAAFDHAVAGQAAVPPAEGHCALPAPPGRTTIAGAARLPYHSRAPPPRLA